MKKELIAAIDIGSHAMRMRIGEIKQDGSFKELESFRKLVSLGHDTFTTGRVSFETVDRVCDMLSIFKQTMNDYGVETYQALATSAIREASNKSYIVDQIRLKTGLELRVISNSQEQFLTHKSVKYSLENYEQIIEEGAVIVVVGAGSIQVTTYKDSQLTSSQNVKMGALRVKEILNDLELSSLKYQEILEEYIDANLKGLDFFAKDIEYKHFIAVGGETNMLQKIISIEDHVEDVSSISKARFKKLFRSLSCMTVEEIARTYNIKQGRASIIIPSMMLFFKFLEQAKTKEMIIPNTSLVNGIVHSMYEFEFSQEDKEAFARDIITNAKVIASKFETDEAHAYAVETYAEQIFESTKELHGLERYDSLLLRLSCILHDCGKFISLDQHYKHSYDLIRSLEIFGLSDDDMEVVANIARYHSSIAPNFQSQDYRYLSERDRVKVAKLVAIIRLADALDRGHRQKITINSIKLKNKDLIIKGVSQSHVNLEEWAFKRKADFFMTVFGINPVLKIKKEI